MGKLFWCRTEDVRTVKEGDMADRWKIGTPLGIGNEDMSKQSAGERDEESNEDKLEARTRNLKNKQNGCMIE